MSDHANAFVTLILKKTGLFTDFQISQILAAEDTDGTGIVGVIIRLAMVREDEFLKKVGEVLGFKYTEISDIRPTDEAITSLPARAVYQYHVLPISVEAGILNVVAGNPFNTSMVDGLRLAAKCPVEVSLSTHDEIDKAIRKYYGVGADAIEKMISDDRYSVDSDLDSISKIDVNEIGAEASIVKFVNQIISEADRQGATDIHVEPMDAELRIRYRIDGMLHKVDVPPQLNRLKAAIISRIKVMANLDIAEKRLPMDGRIGIRLANDDIDIRVSTMPTAFGESISLRLLQKAGNFVKLKDLGFNSFDYDNVIKLVNRPNGIFLVTGPTGSGKSTSLYAFLHEINKMQVRILTAEDPIEYEMAGINQVLVRPDIGLTFARALRAFLRQDPDIIMVGEIRDGETAEIAINASLTGHLVFSTLHTNDAAGAFARLIDMGAEPFLVASAVAGVMAQRLVRRLCPECKQEIPLDMKWYDLEYPPQSDKVWTTKGCEACTGTGYRGRRGLFELLVVSEEIESQIIARKSSAEIRAQAALQGMKKLREDGWVKIFNGVTSIQEVMRVTED
ncbi:MAG: GspE/PulE family protein [Kiritimatiellae bacterium]|jgi:general secretion pathway protein E|nr:GspE/PulE family protein [Kiritimatiellia bacterium]